ncbi:MAG: Clp protease N-terminal domain-containing protein, partial [Thermodesulfobacteriota bacterium]
MNLNQFTQKVQEALAEAQNVAIEHKHQQIDAEHLLMALLNLPEGLLPRFFQKMEIPVASFVQGLEDRLQRLPQVSGPG